MGIRQNKQKERKPIKTQWIYTNKDPLIHICRTPIKHTKLKYRLSATIRERTDSDHSTLETILNCMYHAVKLKQPNNILSFILFISRTDFILYKICEKWDLKSMETFASLM